MDEKPKSGYDRYNELLEKKKRHDDRNIVPTAISIMGAVCLLVGVLSIFSELFSLIESLVLIESSFFLFGFSIIVKAALKYLEK